MSKPLLYTGVVLILLAIIAVTLESSQQKEQTPQSNTLSFSEFDEIVQSPISKISPVELAEALMAQQQHYNLFDLRIGEVDYQIPTAESVTLQQVLDKNIAINENIWLYSENETTAIQVYYLLLVRGFFKVKVVTAGMSGWKQDILMPNADLIPGNQKIRRQLISEFFGGSFTSDKNHFSVKPVQLTKKHKKHHGC